ncbi:E4 34K [Egyptian fruit bat adenovirus]|uniref:E4 34K n=1 Tax=Egyptian fruit bat adenovirus TaxID=2849732 RepID=A0A344X9V9_9ADEN|nr:E4 34K [Rousettus aegyptiacus adenovirus]AXE75641.1 E4 34K [Egyptian fruit bat adenovirus]
MPSPPLVCTLSNSHTVGTLRSEPACAFFISVRELIAPWDIIFKGHIYRFIKELGFLCFSGLRLTLLYNRIYGYEEWVMHCHCRSPHSLMCRAGAELMRFLYEEFIEGARYNHLFMKYRYYCNHLMPGNVFYLGSIFFRKYHLIYIRFKFRTEMVLCIRKLHCGVSCTMMTDNNILIMRCRSCVNRTEIAAACCMKRTRKFLLKACKILTAYNCVLYDNPKEKRRCTALNNLMKYNITIPMFRYTD